MISPSPYLCPPITLKIRGEYAELKQTGTAYSLRAWVREADKACRANEQLLKEVK